MRRILGLVFAVASFAVSVNAQSFNAWTPKGNIITAAAAGNPSAIFESGCVIVASPCFKLWTGVFNGVGVLNYRESLDGLTSWTASGSNPIVASGVFFPTITKVGSTYYMFADSSITPLSINRWTSSDGISWTLTNAGVLTVGGVGAWDHNTVAQLVLADTSTGTWVGYYNGNIAGGNGGMGLITSTDLGVTWTKVNPSGPTIFSANGEHGPGAGASFLKIGGVYYCWAPASYTGPNAVQLHTLGTSGIFRWSSSSATGPWTQLSINGNQVPVYYAASPADFISTTTGTNLGDFSIVPANGNVYIYYDLGGPSGGEGFVNQAVALGVSQIQLVSGYEGVVGAPIAVFPSLNLVTLASDNFQRANGALGANWTPLATTGTFNAAQIVSHLVEKNTANQADSYYSGISWSGIANQWAQTTIQTVADGSSAAGASTLMNTSGTASAYRSRWVGAFGVSGTWVIEKTVAATSTTLTSNTGFVFNSGDTIMETAYALGGGTVRLLFYWDGIPVGAADDATFSTGAAGFELVSNTGAANAQISAWSGGSFQAAPSLSSGGQVGAFVISSNKSSHEQFNGKVRLDAVR